MLNIVDVGNGAAQTAVTWWQVCIDGLVSLTDRGMLNRFRYYWDIIALLK